MTRDISEALGALRWVQRGVMPEGTCLGDQTVSFVEFAAIFDGERDELLEEMREEERRKTQARAKR